MRIIAGEFRGRRLLAPESDVTRPITDRVKQSLFDILSPYVEDAIIYDCFSGTGSMGLECLSRGAKFVTFFEADRSAIIRLKKNIEAIGVGAQCKIIAGDLFRLAPGASPVKSVDLIFFDPPYRFLNEQPERLSALAQVFAAQLKPDGLLIFRHAADDALKLPAFSRSDLREYGGMAIEFLNPANTQPDSAVSI